MLLALSAVTGWRKVRGTSRSWLRVQLGVGPGEAGHRSSRNARACCTSFCLHLAGPAGRAKTQVIAAVHPLARWGGIHCFHYFHFVRVLKGFENSETQQGLPNAIYDITYPKEHILNSRPASLGHWTKIPLRIPKLDSRFSFMSLESGVLRRSSVTVQKLDQTIMAPY